MRLDKLIEFLVCLYMKKMFWGLSTSIPESKATTSNCPSKYLCFSKIKLRN